MDIHTLRKSLLVYTTSGILIIVSLVASLLIIPMYKELKHNSDGNLLAVSQTKSIAINQYLSRLQDVTMQVTSRTKIREMLEAYNHGAASLEELSEFSRGKLLDAVSQSDDALGVSRLDHSGLLAVQAGKSIPEDMYQKAHNANTPLLIGPFWLENQSFLVSSAPIVNRQGDRIGSDLVLFNLNKLEDLVKDNSGLGQTGYAFLFALRNDVLVNFFPHPRNKTAIAIHDQETERAYREAMRLALDGADGILTRSPHDHVMAYAPVAGTGWALIVQMDSAELYASMKNQITSLTSLTIILLAAGIGGMLLLLRPLTGKIVLHTDELNRKIEEKTITLERELNERIIVEKKLKVFQSDLEKALTRITRISNTDVLTDLPNRRHFFEQFGKELERARRYRRPLSFIILDIDLFKKINDTYGHQTGDLILKGLAATLTNSLCQLTCASQPVEGETSTALRQTDLVGRLGGEEFAILLPETPLQGTTVVAERLRKGVEVASFKDHTGTHQIKITVSMGSCSTTGEEEPFPNQDDFFSFADQALYQAKNNGRNCVICVEYSTQQGET